MLRILAIFIIAVCIMIDDGAAEVQFVGIKRCMDCHVSEGKSWQETAHGKAFELLQTGVRVKEKKMAGLEDRDYTKEETCLPCHTVGFGEPGGYSPYMEEDREKYLTGVGCEMCHRAGSLYVELHEEAGRKYEDEGGTMQRDELVASGQMFDYEEACKRCHLNYRGTPYKGSKPPFMPFNPRIHPKYRFNFEEAIRNRKGVHEHFKLKGVFEGDPVPSFRDEFQAAVKEAELSQPGDAPVID